MNPERRVAGQPALPCFLIASKEVYYGWEGSRTTKTETRRGLNNIGHFARHESLRHYGSVGCMSNHRAAATYTQLPQTPGSAILTIPEGAFMLDLHPMITASLFPAPVFRRSRRHQPASARRETPSTLTPDVLSCAPSTITILPRRPHARSITLVIGDMRRETSPIQQVVTPLSKHVSSQFFSITNWS